MLESLAVQDPLGVELLGVLAVSLTFLALLFNAATLIPADVMATAIGPTRSNKFNTLAHKMSKLVLNAARELYTTIRYGLFLCCVIATQVVIHKTLPATNFEFNLLFFTNFGIEFVVDLSRFLLLVWLAWLFYTSNVLARILYYKRKISF